MSAKKKVPAVLNHYEVPETLPAENFKAKCKYCAKEITGSGKRLSRGTIFLCACLETL